MRKRAPPTSDAHERLPESLPPLSPSQAGRALPAAVRASVAEVGPQAQAVVEAFGIPDHLVAAPIAGDWERYNRVDNKGELLGEAARA